MMRACLRAVGRRWDWGWKVVGWWLAVKRSGCVAKLTPCACGSAWFVASVSGRAGQVAERLKAPVC